MYIRVSSSQNFPASTTRRAMRKVINGDAPFGKYSFPGESTLLPRSLTCSPLAHSPARIRNK